MTREEIREGVAKRCFENCDGMDDDKCIEYSKKYGSDYCRYCGADQVLDYLHSQGVVIKVESNEHTSPECDWCYWNTHKIEPLIEEVK